jgi:hypothetical protein
MGRAGSCFVYRCNAAGNGAVVSDWQVGDLALCVKGGRITRAQKTYCVSAIQLPGEIDLGEKTQNRTGRILLRFLGLSHIHGAWADSQRFRRIKPDAEPCEEEFTVLIKRMKPAKVKQ